MAKVIKRIHHLIIGISLIILPLLSFLTIVAFMEQHIWKVLGYGASVVLWSYVLYQFITIAKMLKDEYK